MPEILIKRKFSHAEMLKEQLAPGKPKTRVAGGWIADIAAMKKVILLCASCTHKFNPGRVNYRREKEFPVCQGQCDGCNTFDHKCSWYIHEELYKTVRSTAQERRALSLSREKRVAKGDLT